MIRPRYSIHPGELTGMKLAIIGGTSLIGSNFFERGQRRAPRVGKTSVNLIVSGDAVYLPRHGIGPGHILPHLIDHAANFRALQCLGVTTVAAVCSVGSLRRSLTPRHFCVPDDYVSFWSPVTAVENEARHITPGLDGDVRAALIRELKRRKLPCLAGGVYVQTPGPRLETRAEVRFLAGFGDVVGMTMASEATVARELGLGYAALCVVDNFANGLVRRPLSVDQINASARAKIPVIVSILNDIIKNLS